MGEAAFKVPWEVAIAPDGNVHVVGALSNNVALFSTEGTFVRSLKLHGPRDVAVDAAGYSIATEHTCRAGRVKFFDPHGNLIHTLEGLTHPIGVHKMVQFG